MQQYTHDYTLVQEADSHLYAAQQLEAHEQPEEAWKHIADARQKLQQYLSQDNIVPDDDTADGWVKASDLVVRVTPSDIKAAAKVVRHGQIDRQYKQQINGVGDPSCPLYDKVVRITGSYEQIGMSRNQVAAACQRMGAKSASEGFVKSMDVFIMGNDAGPSKLKKVQNLRAEGRDVRILSLIEFKEILDKYDKG